MIMQKQIISSYKLHRVCLPLDVPIGDSNVTFTRHWITILEIFTSEGFCGTGFELQQGRPTAAVAQLKEMFEFSSWPYPLSSVLAVPRTRGGNIGSRFMSLAIEMALWDLSGKILGLPLYKLLGGNNARARAYGSTLDFPLSEKQYVTKLEKIAEQGFKAVKIKVGYPNIRDDIKRLKRALEIVGKNIDLMADANEAWTVKETLYRINEYLNKGIKIYWIEDPILRNDYQGYAFLCQNSPNVLINNGEYVDFSGKYRILEHKAADVINLNEEINAGRIIARLANEQNINISFRNTTMELGVHLAASLAGCLYIEYADLSWNKLAKWKRWASARSSRVPAIKTSAASMAFAPVL